MATLDQQRAAMAYEHVGEVKKVDDDKKKRKYASMVHAMPALLRSAGLSQALHFVASRKNENQKLLLAHFVKQLARADTRIKDEASLLTRVRESDLDAYLRLTHEALACASWYRRMVQAELGIDAADADTGGDDD